MIKTFLILINLVNILYSSQQIILVVSADINSSVAKLECYEENQIMFQTIDVNIGKNGLGLGLGEINLVQNSSELLKYEGDKKAPIGVFKSTHIFGYEKNTKFKMPYLYANKDLICVDDSDSKFYNKIVQRKGDEKSFEFMKRDDSQYELGIVVEHNKQAQKRRGSCIFLHVKKSEDSPTAGCTAMSLDEIKKITNWLDKDKNPILIQIPSSSSKEILKLYPQIKSSKLLK